MRNQKERPGAGASSVACVHQHVGMLPRHFGSILAPKVSFVPVSWLVAVPNLTGERRASAKVSLLFHSTGSHFVGRVHRLVTRTQIFPKCSRELSVVCKSSVRNSSLPPAADAFLNPRIDA